MADPTDGVSTDIFGGDSVTGQTLHRGHTLAAYRMPGDKKRTRKITPLPKPDYVNSNAALSAQRNADRAKERMGARSQRKLQDLFAGIIHQTKKTGDGEMTYTKKKDDKDGKKKKIREAYENKRDKTQLKIWVDIKKILQNHVANNGRNGGMVGDVAKAAAVGASVLGIPARMAVGGVTGLISGGVSGLVRGGLKGGKLGLKGLGKAANVFMKTSLGRTLGVVGGVMSAIDIANSYKKLRASKEKGESFLGNGKGEGGFFNSRAMGMLGNVANGALGGAGTGAAIGSFLGPGGTAAGAIIGGITGAVTGLLTSLYAEFKDQIDGAFAAVGNFFKHTDFRKLGVIFGDLVKGGIHAAVEGVKMGFHAAVEGIKEWAPKIGSAALKVAGKIVEWTPIVLKALWDFVLGTAESLLGGMGEFFSDKLKKAGEWIGDSVKSIGAKIGEGINAITNFFTGWIDKVWHGVLDMLPNSTKQNANKIMDNFSGSGNQTALTSDLQRASPEELQFARQSTKDRLGGYNDNIEAYKKLRDEAKAVGNTNLADAYDVQIENMKDKYNRDRLMGPAIERELANRAGMPYYGATDPTNFKPEAGRFGAVTPAFVSSVQNAAGVVAQSSFGDVSPDFLFKVAGKESSFNPNAKNDKGTSKGMYGFINETYDNLYEKYGKQYGLKNDRNDLNTQSVLAAKNAEDNIRILKNKLGRTPTDEEQYLAWVFGPDAAVDFLRRKDLDSTGDAASFMSANPKIQKNNPSFFKNGTRYSDIYHTVTDPLKYYSMNDYQASTTPIAPPPVDATVPRMARAPEVVVVPQYNPIQQKQQPAYNPFGALKTPSDDIPYVNSINTPGGH